MALRVPGAIVTITNDTGIIAAPLFERFPVIIGQGDPFRIVRNQEVVRSSGVVDQLRSVTTINEIVSVGDLPNIANYTAVTDYVLAAGNTISWNGASDSPTLGETYYVTFTESRPASAYDPMLYYDENLIYANHGEGWRTNGNINDVSVGGSLALNAGANGVIIAQLDLSALTDPDTPSLADLETAFIAVRNKLDEITDYKLFLIPMSSGTLATTTAASIFFNHAVLASQPENKQERTVLAALGSGTTYQQFATYAQAYAHERMSVPAIPDATVSVVGYAGSTYDMRFYNAALSGLICSRGIGIEVSGEIVPGITFERNYTPKELKYLVQRGVSPANIRGEVVRNVLAITTDTTNALTESLGVQDVKDYVKKYWREALFAAYKNRRINRNLLAQIRSSSINILEQLIADEIIADQRAVSVSQDISEPRKVNIYGKIQPGYGLQWMDVNFVFVLSFS